MSGGIESMETGYVEVVGGKIFYITFQNENSQKDPIIVLHGGAGKLDHSYLLPQMCNLVNNTTVTFYDQRGTGKSSGFNLNSAAINIDDYIKDLEALRNEFGYKKFVLIGHSWGGLLAMRYATLYQEYISKLVLIDAIPASADGFKVFSFEFAKKQVLIQDELNKIKASDEFNRGDTNAIRDYYHKSYSIYFYDPKLARLLSVDMSMQSYENGTIIRNILGATYLKTYDITTELKKLKLPTLIVHGDHDIVPSWTALQTHDLIKNSKIVIINNCGHFPYIEEPKRFFAIIEQFLNNVESH